ncbi:hypothetical protein EB796_003176 [Bugula neritina]|uniref:Uncharacterized protein n=1 Tax=Bugula neritina TaxID=10212 RepID=A0A7J7KIV1_BUGNE|nr:hypothetical protein EB796_003176 [Bugula neritina]
MLMMEPDPVQRPTAESLLSLVVIKKVQRYNSLRKQKEVMEAKLLNLWHYILHLLTLFWGLFTPTEVDLPVGEDADLSRSSASDVVINSSWDSDEDVFMDSSISRTLDFSSESNESEEFTLPFRPPPPKCLTTGARRQPVRTARIMGGVESPVKTPSQGSPILLPSSRSSRSSTAAAAAAPNPSSTTPPSCRKKMIFDNEDNYLPIGPKNLMAVFDAADSDNEGL